MAPMSQGCVGTGSCLYLLEEVTIYMSHLQKGPHFSHLHIMPSLTAYASFSGQEEVLVHNPQNQMGMSRNISHSFMNVNF